jgi:molybdopterin converting factor small subunit
MAKKSLLCPFSKGPCVECAIYRGRHYYLCFARDYRGYAGEGDDGGRGHGRTFSDNFAEIDRVIEAWSVRNRSVDGYVTEGVRVVVRSNLRLRHGTALPDLRLAEDATLMELLRGLAGHLDFPIFDAREGGIDSAVLVTVNHVPYDELEEDLDTVLADGDEVGISLVLVAGG